MDIYIKYQHRIEDLLEFHATLLGSTLREQNFCLVKPIAFSKDVNDLKMIANVIMNSKNINISTVSDCRHIL